MTINQLQCFVDVAETLSFSKAAKQNFVSQPTVSRYITELENEFGVPLFIRSRAQVELSNAGKSILPYAVEICGAYKKAKSMVKLLENGSEGRICLTCDAVSQAFPVKCIQRFRQKHPSVQLDVVQVNGNDYSTALCSVEYDFHFMLRDMLPYNNNIESFATHTDTLSVVVPENFEAVDDIMQLKNEAFVLLSEIKFPTLYMETMDVFRTRRFSPEVVGHMDSVKSVLMAVQAGIAISVLPTQLVQSTGVMGVKAIQIPNIDTMLSYCVAWRKNTTNPYAEAFLDTVREISKEESLIK